MFLNVSFFNYITNQEEDDDVTDEEEGMWEETFKSHVDTKPNGEINIQLYFFLFIVLPQKSIIYENPQFNCTTLIKL